MACPTAAQQQPPQPPPHPLGQPWCLRQSGSSFSPAHPVSRAGNDQPCAQMRKAEAQAGEGAVGVRTSQQTLTRLRSPRQCPKDTDTRLPRVLPLQGPTGAARSPPSPAWPLGFCLLSRQCLAPSPAGCAVAQGPGQSRVCWTDDSHILACVCKFGGLHLCASLLSHQGLGNRGTAERVP